MSLGERDGMLVSLICLTLIIFIRMKSLNPNFTNSPLHNNHASRDGPAIKFGRVIGWRQLKNSRGLLECVWEKDGGKGWNRRNFDEFDPNTFWFQIWVLGFLGWLIR